MIYTIPPLVAEPIFYIGNFPVTNSYINSILAVLFFVIVGFVLHKKTSLIPKGIQNVAEGILEFMLSYMDQVTHDRKKSLTFLPIVGGLFLFILFSNWIGILPGVGSIGRFIDVHGNTELVPILRSANADLNMTLSMAVFAVAVSHIFGVATIGFLRYANRFIKLGDVVRSFRKGSMSLMVALFEFVVGIIEIISEIAKLISLSLRLFGNIFAGEVLLTVIAGLIAFVVPLPFIFLELLVGIIQALVFSMLTLVYLVMATAQLPQEAHY